MVTVNNTAGEKIEKDRWKARRRMACAALAGGLLYPALLTLSGSEQLEAIAVHFYLFVGSVVGAYIGFSTYDDKWSRNA